MVEVLDIIVEDGRRRRNRNKGRGVAGMKLVDVLIIVVVVISGDAKTLRPVESNGFALFKNGVAIRTETIDSRETALKSLVAVFIRSIPRTRSSIGSDDDQPGVEGNSSTFNLNVKRVAVKKLEKKGERKPRTMKVVKNNNLLVLVTIPPFGVVFVVSIWVDSSRKVGLSQARGSVKDKNVSFEPSLGNSSKTVKSGDSIVLGNDRERFRIAPDVLDRDTCIEAFLEQKEISSFALLRLIAVSPRTVDSRLLLGAVSLGFFVLSTAKLPVSTRIEKLHSVKRLVGLEADVALIVRGSFVASFHLPDTI